MHEVLEKEMGNDRYHGLVLTTGSAGTIACGDYLKEQYPTSRVVAGEAIQCPTLRLSGYGYHRIEGIGDKHVPWIHNVRNTDMVIGIDDRDTMRLIRLFNEPAGREYLKNEIGVPPKIVDKLDLLGISSIANVLMAVKYAKYYELTSDDIIITCFTDSMELYQSRLEEARQKQGEYTRENAIRDYHQHIVAQKTDAIQELGYYERKRIHHLKYFTWIEQQGFPLDKLNAQWYDYDEYWPAIRKMVNPIDDLICKFNDKVGLLK